MILLLKNLSLTVLNICLVFKLKEWKKGEEERKGEQSREVGRIEEEVGKEKKKKERKSQEEKDHG